MTMSVRLDAKAERLVERLAKKKGQSKSQVLREAIAVLARQESTSGKGGFPFETVEELIGSVRGGPANLSRRTGEKFRRLLVEARAKRA